MCCLGLNYTFFSCVLLRNRHLLNCISQFPVVCMVTIINHHWLLMGTEEDLELLQGISLYNNLTYLYHLPQLRYSELLDLFLFISILITIQQNMFSCYLSGKIVALKYSICLWCTVISQICFVRYTLSLKANIFFGIFFYD